MTLDGLKQTAGRLAGFRFLFVILVNLIPVGGVVFLNWHAGGILILYWIENVIIGLLTLPRIVMASGGTTPAGRGSQAAGRIGLACFFVVHYGIFTLVHGLIALVVASRFVVGPNDQIWPETGLGWAIATTAILHLVAFFRDWVRPAASRNTTPTLEMFRPYGRIFVLHITVMLSAWSLAELAAPTWTVLILCLLKAVLELIIEGLARVVKVAI